MCSPAPQDAEIGGSEFTSIISYIANSRSAWEIRPCLKRNRRKKEKGKEGGREEEKGRGREGRKKVGGRQEREGRGGEKNGGEENSCHVSILVHLELYSKLPYSRWMLNIRTSLLTESAPSPPHTHICSTASYSFSVLHKDKGKGTPLPSSIRAWPSALSYYPETIAPSTS